MDPADSVSQACCSRVLWLPYGQRGDTYPVAPVVAALAEAGAEILVCAQLGQAELVRSLGLPFRGYSGLLSYDWSRMTGQDTFHVDPKDDADWFRRRARVEVDEVVAAVSDFEPDLVLASSFVTGAGFAAELTGLPWVSYVAYAVDEESESDEMFRSWWRQWGEGPTAEAAWWNDLRTFVGLAPTGQGSWNRWYRCSRQLTLLLTHPELRLSASRTPPYIRQVCVGPWDEASSNSVIPWPAGDGARVLVSNSSAWQADADLVTASFEALADMQVRVLATLAAEHTLLTRPPENASITGYLPHSQVLREADVVVCTAGQGTVSKALWLGVPIVMAPYDRDQPIVAAAAARLPCAINIGWPPAPDAVRRAVTQALTSTEVRSSARRLAGLVPSVADPATVAREILELAKRNTSTSPGLLT
jgi:UDP:flavonoid glycosyltransferase YjiC (YdhE family)